VWKDSPVYIESLNEDDANMWRATVTDGTARIVGALMVWCAILAVSKDNIVAEEEYKHPAFVALVKSLMQIPVIIDDNSQSPLDSRIDAVARQNQNSKAPDATEFVVFGSGVPKSSWLPMASSRPASFWLQPKLTKSASHPTRGSKR